MSIELKEHDQDAYGELRENKKRQKVDEKIQSLIEWTEKYPDILVSQKHKNASLKLSSYAKLIVRENGVNPENNHLSIHEVEDKLEKEYERMIKYYEYVCRRKNGGKLSKEQEDLLREGKIRGIFGYPKEVERIANKYNANEEHVLQIIDKYNTTKELEDNIETLSKIYKTNERNIINILSEYKTVSDFIMHKLWGKAGDKRYLYANVDEEMLRNEKGIDMNFKEDSGLNSLALALAGYEIGDDLGHLKFKFFYDSEKLLDLIEKSLNDDEKEIIKSRFGIDERTTKTYVELAKEYQVVKDTIRNKEKKALKKLNQNEETNAIYDFSHIDLSELNDEEIDMITNFFEKIIFKPDVKYKNKPYDIGKDKMLDFANTLTDINKAIKTMNFADIDFRRKNRKYLQQLYQNPNSFGDIMKDIDSSISMEEIDSTSINEYKQLKEEIIKVFVEREILPKLKNSNHIDIENDSSNKYHSIAEFIGNIDTKVPVKCIDVSDRMLGCLIKFGIDTMEDLKKSDIHKVKGISDKGRQEITDKITLYDDKINKLIGDNNRYSNKEDIFKEPSISELNLSLRAYNALMRAGICTIGELKKVLDEKDIYGFRGIGSKLVDEINSALEKYRKQSENSSAETEERQEKIKFGIDTMEDLKKSDIHKVKGISDKGRQEITDKITLYDDKINKLIGDNNRYSNKEDIFKEPSISELNLSLRAYNALMRAGICTIGELKKVLDEKDIYGFRGIGSKLVDEINSALEKYRKQSENSSAEIEERQEKIQKAKKLMALNKKQDEEISKLESQIQMKGKGIDE